MRCGRELTVRLGQQQLHNGFRKAEITHGAAPPAVDPRRAPLAARQRLLRRPDITPGRCCGARPPDPAADDDTPVPVQKALAAMTAFSNRYVKVSGTKYCSEPSVPAVVIRGLAEHKAALGAPLCPCRNYVDKEAEAKSGYWNCPCVPMRAPGTK